MGRSTMPLLSMLAVLIILVHSEESMERENHHISPRLAEFGSPDYDQSWRVVDVVPINSESAPTEEWDDVWGQEHPKQRRPGRKRKRWHQTSKTEDVQESDERRTGYEENVNRYRKPEPSSFETTDAIKRKRKRPEEKNISQEPQKPQRRRGLRRKRPTPIETSERQNDYVPFKTEEQKTSYVIGEIENTNKEKNNNKQHRKDNKNHNKHGDDWDERENHREVISHRQEIDNKSTQKEQPQRFSVNMGMGKNDEFGKDDSLAQFSMETNKDAQYYREYDRSNDEQEEFDDSMHDQFYKTIHSSEKEHERASNVKSLKEFLKRSDGASLSEMLQRRNVSLADLLNGKQGAIYDLEKEPNIHSDESKQPDKQDDMEDNKSSKQDMIKNDSAEKMYFPLPVKNFTDTETVREHTDLENNYESNDHIRRKSNTRSFEEITQKKESDEDLKENQSSIMTESTPKPTIRRRLPPGVRRRHRIRNSQRNGTIRKNSVDHISMTETENVSKRSPIKEAENLTEVNSKENYNISSNNTFEDKMFEIANMSTSEESTTVGYILSNHNNIFEVDSNMSNESLVTTTKTGKKMITVPTQNDLTTTEMVSHSTTTEQSISNIRPKITKTTSERRRHILTSRLKKKRPNQNEYSGNGINEISGRNSTSVTSSVSASTINEKTQKSERPVTTIQPDNHKDSTSSDDDDTNDSIMKLETTTKPNVKLQKTFQQYTTIRNNNIPTPKAAITNIIEENAKKEIEEILNDNNTRARLSKILLERNMTINELLEHRERGSSQVHLADIFHNASREPNPLEPFLSKSSIEPISKETYPLRALLEANLHDAATTTGNPEKYPSQYPDIPIVMKYGNNVNENGEKMGIVSLFNKQENHPDVDKNALKKDSEGTPYFTSVMSVNISSETREGRQLNKDSVLDEIKEIFSTIRKVFQNDTESKSEQHTKETIPDISSKTINLEDRDGDGVIVLDDLQHLSELDNSVVQMANEKLQAKIYEDTESSTNKHGILDKIPNNTKSVTVATATIVGLTMLLFLLTYIGCKLKQKRSVLRKKNSFNCERIPTPVFENRKSNKNCSMRSISPMLSSSNIYTMSTIDSRHGEESPDYMWDSLRKPFQ